MHDISSSNEPIYLKFRLNHAQIKIFNFTIFKKFGIAKKTCQKGKFFSNCRHFVKKYLFDFSKVHAIAASILIKNPFGSFASDDQEDWNHARQDTLFLAPTLPARNFVNFEFFRLIFYVILKYQ